MDENRHPASLIDPRPVNAHSYVITNEMREKVLQGLPPAARGVLDGIIRNGLGSALGFPGSGGIGYPGSPFSEQVSDTTTLFKNLRWYLISNFRQLLSECYVEIGLIQTICRVPVDDALRGGVEIKSKELSEDQIQELQVSLDRDDDLNTIGEAAVWQRLFGGAGVVILTEQDPETEFQLDLIGPDSKLEFRAVDMWELFWDQQNTEGYDPEVQDEWFEWYNYYAVKLHRSRVMRLKGLTAPSFIRPRLRGWGFSVVEALVRSINQYLKATDLGFEVLDEFKLDIFKIKNLVNTLLSPGGDQQVRQRVQMANWQKNYQNALVMDAEDDYVQKQLSFAGLADTMAGIRMQVAADMRMPITKLFGSQSGGLNSDDETDLEVYNSMIESEVRGKLKYDILRVCEIKCQKLFGMVPEDLSLTFAPLRVLGAVDEETVKTQKFTRAHTAATTGLITVEEFRDICNRDELLGIQLEELPEGGLLAPEEEGEDGDEADTASESSSAEEPGANREEQRTGEAPDVKNSPAVPMPRGMEMDLLTRWVRPYGGLDRTVRLVNSAEFDRASYYADGGDNWIDSRRQRIFERPMGVDPQLWQKAQEAARKQLGVESWKFTVWMYKKLGGKFQ
jgi:phage-related protein (TIGR01555 family)